MDTYSLCGRKEPSLPGILDILERTSLEQPVRCHPLILMLEVCTQDKGEQR